MQAWVIRPQLLQIKGVSDVLVQGGDVKELRLEIDQEKLNNYGITFSEVVQRLDGVFNNASGGILINEGKEYPIRLFSPFTNAVTQAENIVISKSRDGNIILGEVAKISYQDSPVRGSASVDGEDGVILRIVKQADVETLSLSKEIDEKIAIIGNSLPENTILLTDLFRQETFV